MPTPLIPSAVNTIAAKIVNGDGTNLITVYDPPTNGGRIDSLILVSDDTSARDVQFVITISSVDYILGTVSVAANSGTTSAYPVKNVLTDGNWAYWLYDQVGNKTLYLKDTAVLKAKATATITSGKTIYISGMVGEF